MNVPFLSLEKINNDLSAEIEIAVKSVIDSSVFIGGDILDEFENNFAIYTQAKYCVGVANGLDALILALKALNISTGDEIIVPSNTFIATWLAVSHCGAIPVPVEPSEDYSIDVSKIEDAITSKTRVILPVHLYGNSAELNSILDIAKKYSLYVVEDAAQAHGAIYKDRKIGSHGDIVTWSFYPGKNLGAFGDGGAITTNREDIASKIRILGNYGSEKKYSNSLMGLNSRLDPIQAAVLNVKLKYLDSWNKNRRNIAYRYLSELKAEGLSLPEKIKIDYSSWHLFPIRSVNRDKVREELFQNGIETLVHYPIPPHKQKIYCKDFLNANLKICENYSKELISIPIGPHLSSENIDYIIHQINNLYLN
jgi:dTDP-4-amino-4,6-dideoxygalactose transaminase